MAVGTWTEGDLQRFIHETLGSEFGVVPLHRVSGSLPVERLKGTLPADQLPSSLPFPELDADPDAPAEGAVVYCINDNGFGKRELRARFPTGAVQPIATEP